MRSFKVIMFDFDGVIAESVNVKTEAFRKIYAPFGREVSDKVVAHHKMNGGMSRFEKFKYYHKEFLNISLSGHEIKELSQLFSDLVVDGVVNSQEVPGATNFLKKYSEKKDFWIISGTPTQELREIVRRKNIDSYFLNCYGSPEKKDFWVSKLIKENNYRSEDILFLGDAMADYEAAILNGVTFALREYHENTKLFSSYDCIRFNDFFQLDEMIEECV